MQLGPEQFKEWMRRARMTQSDAGRYLGVSESLISNIVNGKYRPGLTVAIKIERHTGIPVEAWNASELEESDDAVAGHPGKRNLAR